MRASRYYAPTLRQAPVEAEIASHKMLVRGGFIRPLTAGVFDWLPLGLRVLRKVETVVREEMERAGALEVHLPVLAPRELWEQSGRWDTFQPTPFRVQDRTERWFCLGPTHEEVMTDLVATDLKSYRDLPLTLYQIQVKFRDEMRPRGGLLRVKEFTMKDAYSFDVDRAGLDASYEAQYQAYLRIMERLQLPVLVVRADAGSMGGSDTREFMILTDAGEDTIFICDKCDYASNAECATFKVPEPRKGPNRCGDSALVETPGMKTIEQVCEFLQTTPEALAKTLILNADGRLVAAMVRGDRELNEFKLRNLLGATTLRMATPEEVFTATGASVGFSGPCQLSDEVEIIADHEIANMTDITVGANKDDAHLVCVNVERDFVVDRFADIRHAVPGDPCPMCGEGYLGTDKGIEIGHVFKLGTKYAEALGAKFLDEDGKEKVAIMGCYGMGVSRAVAALVEVHHDDNGIIWPLSVAPFQVAVLLLDPQVHDLGQAADQLEAELSAAGLDVMIDDRDERPGVKFKDADLIGYPIQVVVGKRTAQEGTVEVRRRRDKAELVVPLAEATAAVQKLAEEA
ncbi:MAG: proline--tRNA ligase [Armatimonadia bacterium]